MSSSPANETVRLLKDFVERNAHIAGIHWDPRLTPRLIVKPRSNDYEERRKVAHFFLFVAAVSETRLIERAEHARYLLVNLHSKMGDRLFGAAEAADFWSRVGNCGFYEELGLERQAIPEVLASVNRFVKQQAHGDLIQYSRQFANPEAFVKEVSARIPRMSGPHIEKSWMYMRWMVRPAPDLGIFNHFSPRDLSIPLTTDVINVAASIGLMHHAAHSSLRSQEAVEHARHQVKDFAKTLFPEDPAKVDYPFFLLGRWMRGMELNETNLIHSLRLFDEVYRKTGYACVDYQIVAYTESGWEELLEENLKKTGIPYDLKPFKSPLPNGLVYTPDFVLRQATIKGRKIILEPHGRMNKEEVQKYSLFKQMYGRDCYLVLIMRNEDIEYYRARGLLPEEICDDIWPVEYLGMLLTQLKNNQYNASN